MLLYQKCILALQSLATVIALANELPDSNKMYQISSPSGVVKVFITQSNLLDQKVDAIVNAANVSLIGSAGVAKAIQNAAGKELLSYIKDNMPVLQTASAWGVIRCNVGQSCITPAFNLEKNDIKYIIHTVGPDLNDPAQKAQAEKLLRSAYRTSLELVTQKNLTSIAFPALSTGVFGYPIEQATEIACDEIKSFITNNASSLKEIRFVVFKNNFPVYCTIAEKILHQ